MPRLLTATVTTRGEREIKRLLDLANQSHDAFAPFHDGWAYCRCDTAELSRTLTAALTALASYTIKRRRR